MPLSCPRAVRPLNQKAAHKADVALYDAHQNDARPNALFDKDGKKKALNPTDSSQESLRHEWFRHYGKAGGKVEESNSKNNKPIGSTTQKCPLASLTISVIYKPLKTPINDALVTIKGPVTKTLKTDDTGVVKFVDLPPGNYEVTSKYAGTNSLVELAKKNVGKTDWAFDNARDPYPKKRNKCNLFVYEMVTGAGFPVPMKSHEQKFLGMTVNTVYYPPLAGDDWANASSPNIPYATVASPEPGDVIAYAHQYSDASGHVGIVSYPKDSSPDSKVLKAGENAESEIMMERQTISAGASTVDENDSIWRKYDKEADKILFRRIK